MDTFADITPVSCERTEDNLFKIAGRTKDGNMVYATMSGTALLNLINMAVQQVNNHTAQIISALAPNC